MAICKSVYDMIPHHVAPHLPQSCIPFPSLDQYLKKQFNVKFPQIFKGVNGNSAHLAFTQKQKGDLSYK